MEQLLVIGPGQPESAHVRHAEARHDGRNGSGILFRELALHQGVFGPIHQLRLRDDLGAIRVVKRYLNVQGSPSNAESQQQRAWRMPG